jgi:hypothetical protein
MTRYQHARPQRFDDPSYHEEEVEPGDFIDDNKVITLCKHCAKSIIEVDEDEGPESLKSLLRF